LERQGETLVSKTDGSRIYSIVQGVPVFTPGGKMVTRHSPDHISNAISWEALKIISESNGLCLNLSAGGSDVKPENVVELEYSVFRNTDVVGDSHNLPFRDEVFDACICMNAFEHYRDPKLAASEILRVLKPGGRLFLHTAGIQPLHEAPHHYYNVTKFGLAEWLADFDVKHLRVSDNFRPEYALSWLISEIERGISHHQGPVASKVFRNMQMGDMMKFWRDSKSRGGVEWEVFDNLDSETREICAAGWEALAEKPKKVIDTE
jgi:SAM-dependent methyltransferase